MFSTTTRYTGTSGIDVTSMVDAMMQAESLKYNKLNQNVEYLKWQQDAGRTVGNQVKDFQKSFLSLGSANNIRTSGTFTSRKTSVTSTGTGTIGVKPKNNVKPGNYEVKVDKNATNEIRQGATIGSRSEDIKTSPIKAGTIDSMNVGDSFTINYDGTNTTFAFSEDDITKMKEAMTGRGLTESQALAEKMQEKLTAKYGEYDGKPKVSISGNDGSLTIKVPEALGVSVSISSDSTVKNNTVTSGLVMPTGDNKFTADQVATNPTYTFIDKDGNEKTYTVPVTEETTGAEYVSALQDKVDELYGGKSADGTSNVVVGQDEYGRVTFTSTRNTPEYFNVKASFDTTTVTDPGTDTEVTTTSTHMVIGSQTFDDLGNITGTVGVGLKKSTQNMGGVLGVDPQANSNRINTSKKTMESMGIADTTFTINGKTIDVKATDTIDEFMNKVNKSGANVTMSFDKNNNSFKLVGKAEGSMNNIKIDTAGEAVFEKFGLDEVTQAAGDAQVTINGNSVIREGNKFTYDDIEFDLTESKVGETYTVKVESDTTNTMDSIKSFVEGYNSMITALQDATNTTRAKSGSYSYYQPLTDEEKDAMSDKEIEKWEQNAKKGLLYNDPEFSRLTRELRGAMNSNVKLADGSSISLASIGITTEGWETGGKLIIDEDKLQKALEERPDDVKALFTQTGTGIGDKLDKVVNNAVGSDGYISHKYGFEGTLLVSENAISRKIKASNEELDLLKVQLAAKEDHYYTLFSAMEKAVNESNSQMSYLMGLQG